MATFALLVEKKVFATDDSSDTPVPHDEIKNAMVSRDTFNTCPTGFSGKDIYLIKLLLPPLRCCLDCAFMMTFSSNHPFFKTDIHNSFIYNTVPPKWHNVLGLMRQGILEDTVNLNQNRPIIGATDFNICFQQTEGNSKII